MLHKCVTLGILSSILCVTDKGVLATVLCYICVI